MKIVQQIKPPGYDEWHKRAVEKIEKNPEMFAHENPMYRNFRVGGDIYVNFAEQSNNDDLEWDGEQRRPTMEGTKSERQARINARELARKAPSQQDQVQWEPEPALEATQ